MESAYRIQVGRRGVITLPKEIRDEENILDGEILNLIQLSGDLFVISRGSSRVDQAANKLAKAWQESGETLESMLATLREVRSEHDQSRG